MNSVHEPGLRTMSKNLLRNGTESNRVKNRLSASSAHPVGQQHTQAWPHACVLRGPHAYVPPAPAAHPASPCRAPCAPLPRHVADAVAILQYSPAHVPCSQVTIHQSVLRYKLSPAKSLAIQSCNTTEPPSRSILQYT